MPDEVRELLTRDQRPFLHPESPDSQLLLFSSPHSSSTGFRSENTWQEIRDHSFIQNLSRSSDSQLLLFSSSHSSSTGFRSENTWHEIRDHSFIQNLSRSSDSQLLLFSSLTHLLQGSDQRTPDTRSETIPSSRISPDLQIHSFFSSVHSLIFYRVQVREHLTRDQRPFLHPESLQIFRFTASSLQFTSLIFYRVQVREHLTRDQRPFLHPESLQIFRFTASSLQFTSLIFYRVQIREHLTWDQRPFLHPESLQIFRFTASPLQFTSLIFYRVQVREHLTRDQRLFLHPESLQIFRFTASSLQFTHSSSTGFRSENTWHEIRDHSFIQNHSRSSDSQLLLFSSPHSSSTGFRSEDRNGHSRSLVLCSVTHFCVVFEVYVLIIVRLEDPNMAHYKISNRVSHLLIFYLIVFDRIHDTMYLNKMSRTSSRKIGPQHKKYSSIFHCTNGVLFNRCVHQTHLECFLLKSYCFCFIWP